MKATLKINDKRIELGHKELYEISYLLEDAVRNKDIFHELAKSPSAEIRSNILGYSNIHDKTVELLLSDPQIEVMRSFIGSEKAISLMGKEDLQRFIDTEDKEILSNIVNNIVGFTETYEVCQKDWLFEKLFHQKDPSIRYDLAENVDTPEFILRKLTEDQDINVAQKAKETLSEITDELD